MKKVLLVLVGLVVVVIAAAVIVPFLIPTETYKAQLAQQVERATGRQFSIEGPLRFSLLPTLSLEAEGARLANAEGAATPDMAKLKALQVELKLWPLLRGAVEVDRFVLVEPEIHLEIDREGRPNWQLGAPAPSGQPTDGQEQPRGDGGALPIAEVRLGDIRLVDGMVTFSDATAGTSERLENIDMTIDLPDLQSRLRADGSVVYKGETVALELAVERPLALVQGGDSPARISVRSAPVAVGFEGQLSNGAAPGAAGTVKLDVASIRQLAAWLAEPLDFEGEGLQTLAIQGRLEAAPERVAFHEAVIRLDAIEGRGELVAELSGQVPKLTGRLDLDAVDLNPYLPPEAPQAAAAPRSDGERPSDARDAGPADWSDEPIELPPIGGAEVDFELTLDALTVRDLRLDRTVLALALQGTTLKADLREIALYDGTGSGTLTVRLVDGAPTIEQQFRLDGLRALPFLTDAAELDRVEGTLAANLAVTTRGRTQRELVQNLNGDGQAMFSDGAIVGINLAAMVRNVATAFLDPTAGEARKTDFAELGGSFTIRNGVVTNQDMRLQAPALRVNGSGRIDLPARRLSYRVEPTAAPTLKGQGGRQDVAGILVPVVIEGPWHDLSFRPDLSGLVESALRDPAALQQQLQQLGETPAQLKDAVKELKKQGDVKDMLRGLGGALTGQGDPEQKSDDSQSGDPAQRLLRGLFGN